MATIQITCRWGTPDGSRSTSTTIEAATAQQIEQTARVLIQQSGEPRAFATHHLLEGRAFPGYRSMPREFYGPGL